MDENYNTIKAELLKTGKLFEDEEYPAKQSSIFYKQDGSWKENVEWRRPHVSTQLHVHYSTACLM